MNGPHPRAPRLALTVATAAALAGCHGARPTRAPANAELPAPRVGHGALAVSPLLADVPEKVRGLGGGPPTVLVATPLVEGERAGAFVDVPRDVCLVAYARGAPSVDDLDLAAFTDDGNPVAVDEGPDPSPAILVCPPRPARLFVAVHAASGQGLSAVAAQFIRPSEQVAVARALSAKGALGGTPRTSDAWPGLTEKVAQHRNLLGGSWSELRRVAVDVDARLVSSVEFPVDAGACTDALVVPDSDVALVDGEVVDRQGRVLGRLREVPSGRALTVCSPVPIEGTLELRPHVGRGLVAVVLSRRTPPSLRALENSPNVAWGAPVSPLATARAAADALLAKAGYRAPTTTITGDVAVGRRTIVPIDLPATGCSRLDVVGGAPLAQIDAALWASDGSLLARGDGSAVATLFACGHGKARLDVGTNGRPGPFAVSLRHEPWENPVFSRYPLAASRMLDQAATGPSATFDGTPLAGGTMRASLGVDGMYVQHARIEAGTCLVLAMGAEGEGAGIEARLIDEGEGLELDRAHGERGGSVRACADGEPKAVRLELRATAGKLDAVIGARTIRSGS